jgi:hypothetical protein
LRVVPGGGGGGEGVEGDELGAFDVAGGELGELADVDEARCWVAHESDYMPIW